MPIQSTKIEQLSATTSRIEMTIADRAELDQATTSIHMRMTVEHAANPLLAEVQVAALRSLRDELSAETQRLSALADQRS